VSAGSPPGPAGPGLAARWRQLHADPQFRRGCRDMLPLLPGVAAWGLVTGVAMAKSGLPVPLALLMTFAVYAGTSQLAALPLLAAAAPLWVVWLTGFIVNLRFVIYSAQWRWYFGHLPRRQRLALTFWAADLNYAVFLKAWPQPEPQPGQVPYFLGTVWVVWLGWQIPSVAGILLSDSVPAQWGLGFAGVLALLGLTCSLLTDRATWLCAGVAATAAVAAFALPYKLHVVVAVAAAVAAGIMIDGADGGRGRRAALRKQAPAAPAQEPSA
jgi:predicted branched-subunit amino acid permease